MRAPMQDAEHVEIRAAVRRICGRFPGEYWRRLDREMAYPTEFVSALGQAGFLAALIPEEYGGAVSTCPPQPRFPRNSAV